MVYGAGGLGGGGGAGNSNTTTEDDGVDEEGAPVLPENIVFGGEEGKSIAESLLKDSKEGIKLIEKIAEYEGKIRVITVSGDDQSHCYSPDENDVILIELNLDRPGISYQYIESDLAHEFSHAIDFLSGYYDEKMKSIERDASFRQNFHGWDKELTNAYIKNKRHEYFERPAIRAGRSVDEELIEKRGVPGFD